MFPNICKGKIKIICLVHENKTHKIVLFCLIFICQTFNFVLYIADVSLFDVWPCQKKHQYQKFSKFSALFYYKWSEIQTTLMSTDDLVLNQSRCKDFFAAYEGGPQNFLQTDITNRCFYWFTCICNLNWKINWTRILASSKSTSILSWL